MALQGANLDFIEGEVHSLVGANGAGKSTLCKILSGAVTPSEGEINLNGQTFCKFNPNEAKHQGIGIIYQEFNLVNDMPIYENLFLGKEIRKGPLINVGEMIDRSNELFKTMGVTIDPRKNISDVSIAYCQLVEIGKALLENSKILIMDEPTAPLTNYEVDVLFKLIKNLNKKGITIIYISHRMEEIFKLSDRITVMRDGKIIKTLNTRETNSSEIINLMVGKEQNFNFPQRYDVPENSEVVLRARNLTNSKLKGISFDLRKGEIFGLAGLVGAGRTETLRAIFGADKITCGSIEIHGAEKKIRNSSEAIENGIALIPEDRSRQGLHLSLPIKHNATLVIIRRLSKFMTIIREREKSAVDKFIKALSIKLSSVELTVNSLSGGNQQKVVLAKWMVTGADIIFLDEPTRGIDIHTKNEIYGIMDNLRREGKALIMISSDLPEVIGMCDRILVLHEGEMMKEFKWRDVTEHQILHYASGLK